MHEKFSEFISCIVTAISTCSLYSKEHHALTELSGKAAALLETLYAEDAFNITYLGRNLIFNDMPVTDTGIHMETFKKKLRAKGIEKIIIRRGIEIGEIRDFIYEMALKTETPVSSRHMLVGTVNVKLQHPEGSASGMMDEQLSVLKDAYRGISRFKKLDTAGLEDAVAGFISALKRECNVLRIVSPVKSYNEYTYVHSANVSVLTIFQAEALGMKGEILHEAGLSGLLHDVGKLFVSTEVIEKQAKLDEAEWLEMRKHPVYGAVYLSAQSDAPKLAVIAAFEHHMKYDGSGYPETRRHGRRQHIISQMIALADFFDALRTERPYRKAFEAPAIIKLIKENEGRDFNPMLVAVFLRALNRVIKPSPS